MPIPEGKFVTFWSFTFIVTGNLIAVSVTLFLWKYFWLDSQKLSIPYDQKLQPQKRIFKRQLILQGFWRTVKIIRSVIVNVDPQYIIEKVGYQGYFYLLFLRRLIQIQFSLCILDLTIALPYFLLFKELNVYMFISIESQGNAVFRTIHTTITSFIVVYSLYSFRKLVSKTLRFHIVKNKNDNQLMLQWLKLRTLYLQILFRQTQNSTSQQIKNYLQRFLNIDCQTRYKIYSIVPVHDYANLFKKFSQYWNYKTISTQARDQLPKIYSFLSCMNKDKVNYKLEQLEEDINEEKQKEAPVVGMFLVVDSINAIDILRDHFYLTSRFRFCRNFQLIQEIDYPFIINRAFSAGDLIWQNLQYSKSSIIRQFLFNLLSFIVLIFISTPAAVLNWIKVPVILTPYFVIIINSIIFYILSLLVVQQKHFKQSKKQKTQFKMLLFYLSMNMIVGSIARNIKNVTDFLQQGGWMWVQVFELVFKKIDGLYYCTLFFNQLTISLIYSLIKPIEILTNYGWINLYIAKCKLAQRLFYSQNFNFAYAYNYSIIITLFIISIIYSLSIPGIHIFALLLFVGKQYAQTYTLITFHKKQFQSVGDLTIHITFYASLASAAHLFLVANSLLVQKQYFNAIFLYCALGIVIYICYTLKQPIVKQLDLTTDVPKQVSSVNQSDLEAWKRHFQHPLKQRINKIQQQI